MPLIIMLHDSIQIIFLLALIAIMLAIVGLITIYDKFGLKKLLFSVVPITAVLCLSLWGLCNIKIVTHPYSVRISGNNIVQNYLNINDGDFYENHIDSFTKPIIINKKANKTHPTVERTLLHTKVIYGK